MRCKLDDFLNEEKEKMAWSKIEDDVRAAGQLMLTDESSDRNGLVWSGLRVQTRPDQVLT
ncbi:hypothetical protein P3342_002723 [Pyrenophora teres f. teres]|nr:hypothetical protein P3342_002723 [Pyrenophora teres f. teres]